eukprot:CAMPEP_0118945956 /NCGR_PEP_ID=MMETSP1169-20130426/43323_1 /TAXON_ID=36882 /ORGANISM="Pyramimonas obovata, Strain CCMP722" /LENGTH=203 /DNA_ID=CAMNT_0006891805 /DNA_START=276 /DNA_END=884 /DNA_ORIENTATION=-
MYSLESHSTPNITSLLTEEERIASRNYDSYEQGIPPVEARPAVRLSRDLAGHITAPVSVTSLPAQKDLSGHTHYTPSWIWDKRKRLRDHDFPGWGGRRTISISSHLSSISLQTDSLGPSVAPFRPLGSIDSDESQEEHEEARIALLDPPANPEQEEGKRPQVKLGELATTAICGNDILSSVLYTGGLVAVSAGKAAPLCLLMV